MVESFDRMIAQLKAGVRPFYRAFGVVIGRESAGVRYVRAVGRYIKRARKGFTMMELLGVVAILAIVSAIAIPAAGSIQTNLEMTRLDQTAKQIYVAAQNRVTSLQSNGTLTSGTTSIAKQIAATGQSAGTKGVPADYTYDNSGDINVFYMLSSDKLEQDNIITDEAAALTKNLGGSWIIEINPYSGEVYSVFYSENNTSLQYDAVKDKRARADRTADRIGYYCGGKLQKPAEDEKEPFSDLKSDLINSEELYVSIKDPNLRDFYDNPDGFSIKIEIRGTNKDNPYDPEATWVKTYTGKQLVNDGILKTDTTEIDIILDSMRDGMSFAELITNSTGDEGSESILPGSDIHVDCTVTIPSSTKTHGFKDRGDNSLFDKDTKYASNENGSVAVSTVRHLNNLRQGKNTFVWGGIAEYSKIIQTGDINFIRETGSNWATPESVSIQSRDTEGNAYNPLEYFEPIELASDFYNSSRGASIDGTDKNNVSHKISNFIIKSSNSWANNVGLFTTLFCDVSGIHLVNTSVTGGYYSNTGALAGTLTSYGTTSITNCSVTVTKTYDSGVNAGKLRYADYEVTGQSYSYPTGGLVGSVYAGGSIKDCVVQTNVSGKQIVGGMVGYNGNASISGCTQNGNVNDYASITSSSSYAGGLIGRSASSKTIENCKAESNVSGYSFVGGLVGSSDESIYNCSARGESTDNNDDTPPLISAVLSNAGGLVGYFSGESIRYSFAAVDVVASRDGASAFGGFAGYCTSSGGDIQQCYSSGSVQANSNVGGFIGTIYGRDVYYCYSTSNVTADTLAGGFVGGYYGGNVVYNSSYGKVTATGAINDTIHGFAGTYGYYWTDARSNTYLQALDYNDGFKSESVKYASTAASYSSLVAESTDQLTVAQSHPYAANLTGLNFPFTHATDSSGNAIEHWGNWPKVVNIDWYRDDRELLFSDTTLTGITTFTYPGSTSGADWFDAGGVYHNFTSWGTPVIDKQGNISITANCANWPLNSVVDMLYRTDRGSYTFDYDGATYKGTVIWTYLNSNNADKTCDSEAPYTSGFANAATWVNHGLGTMNRDTATYSFSFLAKAGSNLSQIAKNSEGNIVVFVGEKIPTVTPAGQIASSAQVVKYDYVRAAKGLTCRQYGTISVEKSKNSQYYVYNAGSFSAIGGWF